MKRTLFKQTGPLVGASLSNAVHIPRFATPLPNFDSKINSISIAFVNAEND